MVKSRAALGRAACLPRLAPLAAAMLGVLAAPASRADWTIRPGVELRETYTDNVALQPEALAEGQFVTEINPSLRVAHRGRRLNVSADARFNYFIYGDSQVSGTNRFHKQFSGSGTFEAIDDTLFIDASAFYGPRNISPFGTQVSDNQFASANRADVTSYTVAPYLVHRFGTTADLMMRYSRYSLDTGSSGFGTSDSDSLLFNLSSGRAFDTVGWSVRLSRQDLRQTSRTRAISGMLAEQETVTENALASLRYRLSQTFALTATGGYDKYDYAALGGVTAGRTWTTGFTWTPTLRTYLDLSVGKRYIGSTKSLLASHRSRRTVWRVSYTDSVNNMRSTGILPATFDTAALLDGMFQTRFPDEAERRLAVEEYMRTAGLPSSLVDSVSFLSNRYFLQKRLSGSVGLKLAKTNVLWNIYRSRNDALSTSATDSAVLGSTLASFNDNTRQKGSVLTMSYDLSSRSMLRLTHRFTESLSLTNGRSTSNRSLRITGTRKLSRKLTAGVELRRIDGTSISTNYTPYRENAIAAYLTYQR